MSSSAVTITVEVPAGLGAGDSLTLETEEGIEVDVEIPAGLGPGDEFEVELELAGQAQEELAGQAEEEGAPARVLGGEVGHHKADGALEAQVAHRHRQAHRRRRARQPPLGAR